MLKSKKYPKPPKLIVVAKTGEPLDTYGWKLVLQPITARNEAAKLLLQGLRGYTSYGATMERDLEQICGFLHAWQQHTGEQEEAERTKGVRTTTYSNGDEFDEHDVRAVIEGGE